MSLKAKIQEDMKSHMKAGNKQALGAVRLLWSALRKEEIDSRQDVSDEQILGITQKLIKQYEETISFLEKDNRAEEILAQKADADVLRAYLPPQMSEEEMKALVAETVSASGASSPKDMGRVMGILVPKTRGRCDGKILSALVQEALRG